MANVSSSTSIDKSSDKRRRGHGEGTIVERNGKYRAQVLVNGKRISHIADTKTEAQRWIRRTLTTADSGMLPVDGGKITVAEFLDKWLTAKKPSIKPSTYSSYYFNIRDHVVPALGKTKLVSLRADHLQTLYAAKQEAGLSARSVLIVHRLLHKALKDALRWDLVPRNVADAVIAPKPARPKLTVWSSDDSLRFLSETANDRLFPAYCVMLYCGLRAGELVGLRWEDVDLATGRLQIRRTVQRVRGQKGLVVGDPKSASSRRQIVLPTAPTDALRRWRIRQKEDRLLAGENWRDSGYVFASTIGTYMEPRNFHRSFDEAVKRVGLPPIRVHDLRHTCATLLLSRGVLPKIVQELLGHSQISLTMDTDSHVLPTMREEAARTMERILAPA